MRSGVALWERAPWNPVEQMARQAPFDRMERDHLVFLAERFKLQAVQFGCETVSGDVNVAGSSLKVDGIVTGNVDVEGGVVTLGPGSRVGGNC